MNGSKCYKMFLICSNVALLFVGMSIFILGIKMEWALSVLLLINIPIVMKAVKAVIAAGFFISFSGVTGLCGACCENKWLLLGYLISLGVIVVMEFSLGVTLMIVKKTVSAALETPDCNSVCSASIDAAILEYALPSAGLMMTVIFLEASMIYSSIKMYFYVRDGPKALDTGPQTVAQDVQMRNVAGSVSTYIRTPQPMDTSQFEYSPYLGHNLLPQVTRQSSQAVAEELPPDYESLSVQPQPPSYEHSTAVGDSAEHKETDEVFNQV